MFWLNRRFLAKVPCYAPSVLYLGEEAPGNKTSCGKTSDFLRPEMTA